MKYVILGIGSVVTSFVLAAKWYMKPRFPKKDSRENVASFKCRVGSTGAQIFYQIGEGVKRTENRNVYIRDRALYGLSKWLHMPSAALFFLRNKPHPLRYESLPKAKGKSLPILLFSHGTSFTNSSSASTN